MNSRRRFASVFPIFALLISGFFTSASGIGCGTAAIMQRQIAARAAGNVSAVTQATTLLSARTLTTVHFAIHYTMGRNVHRPKMTTQDSAGVLRLADSIYNSLSSSLSSSQHDQAINAGLDSLHAAAPQYIQRAALYFERAYSYYSDSMGMTLPTGGGSDFYFSAPASAGKYIVDVADLYSLVGSDGEATYGLTYPPSGSQSPSGYILLENDFLYLVSMNAAGKITGTPIKAIVNNQALHDYSVDWDLGLKVTASHEFYHAVQFAYTPQITAYHAWYELSATGMEERLAPEVNDYFQYLPCILKDHSTLPLLSTSPFADCNTYPMYGEGIFHQYLTGKLGAKFDVQVWKNLSTNGDNIVTALTSMAATFGSRIDTLYNAYTSTLATAGRAGSASTCTDTTAPIFTRDLNCWPQASMDSIPKTANSVSLAITPLTFRLIKPAVNLTQTLTLTGLNGATRIDQTNAGYSALSLTGTAFQILPNVNGSTLAWDVPNSSFTQNGQLLLSEKTVSLNPAPLSGGTVTFFAPAGSTPPLMLMLTSESGKRVANLSLDSTLTWTWNLKDLQNRNVPPGAYFYGTPGQPVKTLLILAQ